MAGWLGVLVGERKEKRFLSMFAFMAGWLAGWLKWDGKSSNKVPSFSYLPS